MIIYIRFILGFTMLFTKGFSQNLSNKEKPIYYFNPSWSMDGTSILFESTINGESNIYSISKDATNLKQISQYKSGQPAWSPDSKMIVYYRDINHNLQLFINSASGGAERQLLSSGTQDYSASWSAKDIIAFMSNVTADHISHSIYAINADGTNLKRITDTTFDCMAPRWSPDGKKILYIRGTWTSKTYKTISEDEMEKINNSIEIMVMDADGRRSYKIADQSKYKNPVWAPDGKNIYVKSDLDSATVIYRMNKKGKKLTRVCQINKKIGSFEISPQGDFIVFEYEKNKKFSIYTYGIQTGVEQKIIGDL